MKTWLKGLIVFVVSSLVTSASSMTIAPETFNFSRDGLLRVGGLAGVIAIKSVLLYLKQSPLPADPSQQAAQKPE